MLFAAAAMFLPAVHGADAEIYVTTGPDGVEIFSNLPRGPVAQAGLARVQGKAGGALSVLPAGARQQVVEASKEPESPGSEAAEAGKSFLLDD
ncbi:hypothetical protein [Ferribacterium limneticum]|uniref:hypothetical protein n=1 Tax=Ferribacterium limneticum TaxID=76259 RepID=UPI001CFB9AF8|nr:hypothetical protein [Ferribacterium limneticum]UCV17939.1 hypothetical protein KI610_14095 [Ferribacterium limneticum]